MKEWVPKKKKKKQSTGLLRFYNQCLCILVYMQGRSQLICKGGQDFPNLFSELIWTAPPLPPKKFGPSFLYFWAYLAPQNLFITAIKLLIHHLHNEKFFQFTYFLSLENNHHFRFLDYMVCTQSYYFWIFAILFS